MPSVKYFTDPGSRFVKRPASLNILTLCLPNSQFRVFVIFLLVTKNMVCFDILFIWQLNEVVTSRSKRFGRVCLRIEPRLRLQDVPFVGMLFRHLNP